MTTNGGGTDRDGPAADLVTAEAELLRATERDRLRALVAGDMALARRLHTDDFQLIDPGGRTHSKDQYLGGIAAGEIKYLVFEPDSPIVVRLYDQVALLRYQSQIEIIVQGRALPRGRYWHTDCYERRDGQWQVVWSQATAIQ